MSLEPTQSRSFPSVNSSFSQRDNLKKITLLVVGLLVVCSGAYLYGFSINTTAAYLTYSLGGVISLHLLVEYVKSVCSRHPTSPELHESSARLELLSNKEVNTNFLSDLKKGNAEPLKLALKDPDFTPENGLELLNIAAELGKPDLVRQLLDKGIETRKRSSNNHACDTTMEYALRSNQGDQLGVIRILLEKDPEAALRPIGLIKYEPIGTSSPLIEAIILQNADLVRLFIESGADVNLQCGSHHSSQFTPLHYLFAYYKIANLFGDGTQRPNLEIIEILSCAGADPCINARNQHFTPEFLLNCWKQRDMDWHQKNKVKIDKIESIWEETKTRRVYR